VDSSRKSTASGAVPEVAFAANAAAGADIADAGKTHSRAAIKKETPMSRGIFFIIFLPRSENMNMEREVSGTYVHLQKTPRSCSNLFERSDNWDFRIKLFQPGEAFPR
jgi:hypothetical protein